MVTLKGISLIALAAAIFVLAGLSRLGWLLLFDAVLWGTIILSAALPWLTTGKLQVSRRVLGWEPHEGVPGPMEGDAVELESVVTNAGWLPCVFGLVRHNLEGLAEVESHPRLFIAWLGRGGQVATVSRVRFQRRGLHRLPPATVQAEMPFGLFCRRKRISAPLELLVYPRVYPMAGFSLAGSAGEADSAAVKVRVGEQVTGSRAYIHGDPVQHIHWRNTARSFQLQTREFESFPGRAVAIVFSTRQSSGEEVEHAIRLAASAGSHLCSAMSAVRLVAGSVNQEFVTPAELLKSLALLGPTGAGLPDLLAAVPPATDLLAIVSEADEQGVDAIIEKAGEHGRPAVVLLRGFVGQAGEAGQLERLRRAGIRAVECWPGQVPAALARLADSSEEQLHSGPSRHANLHR